MVSAWKTVPAQRHGKTVRESVTENTTYAASWKGVTENGTYDASR